MPGLFIHLKGAVFEIEYRVSRAAGSQKPFALCESITKTGLPSRWASICLSVKSGKYLLVILCDGFNFEGIVTELRR